MMVGALLLALMVAPLGCSRYKTFRFSFSNRTEHVIVAKIDGERLGDVPPGESAQFEQDVRVLESSPTGYGSTDEAEITASAEDRQTGKVTREMRQRAYRDRVNHFDINPGDFN